MSTDHLPVETDEGEIVLPETVIADTIEPLESGDAICVRAKDSADWIRIHPDSYISVREVYGARPDSPEEYSRGHLYNDLRHVARAVEAASDEQFDRVYEDAVE